MPSSRGPAARPGGGPGRAKQRARTATRKGTAAAAKTPGQEPRTALPPPEPTAPVRRRQSSLTARAIALAVVLLILTISYASSLRIYFAQAHEIASTKAEIASRQQRIAELKVELARWENLDYVRTQARERLGWVVPGEIGYRVVDANGKPLGGGAEITAETRPTEESPDAWWSKLWGSVQAADQPAPAPVKPKEPKPITEKTKPR